MPKNNILILTLTSILFACSGTNEQVAETRLDSLGRPENIKTVSALAKVEPANGLISLSTEVSGIVVETYKKEGDTVKKGDLLFKLNNQNESLQTQSSRQETITQQAKVAANKADIRQYEAALMEKEQDLAITQKLAATGADTRQNVIIKQKEKEVILSNLQAAKAQLNASLSELENLRTKLKQSELDNKNRFITAKQDGILVNFDPQLGTAINAFSPFAVLAPTDNLVLHGEIDEMFADRVKLNQTVEVNYVGDTTTIAKGTVSYLSPILENKSLFYEKSGEISDRRVRLFKVALTTPVKLLINSKVECKIKIQ